MMEQTDRNIVKAAITPRADDTHKGSAGTLLSICGCYGMAGAAMLSSLAALRCGIGLLRCATVRSIYPILAQAIPESVYLPLTETEGGALSAANTERLLQEAQKADAVLLGCGLSVCEDTKELVRAFVRRCQTPMVLDADALNAIADCPEILRKAQTDIILTPHPGEMARLCGTVTAAINSDREQVALRFASEHNTVTVLKGSGTVIASPDGRCMINRTGNSGMATGGSGDVLAGMTASLLAQNRKPFACAAAAVYLHGLAGDYAAQQLGKRSLLPRDIIDNLPRALQYCGIK